MFKTELTLHSSAHHLSKTKWFLVYSTICHSNRCHFQFCQKCFSLHSSLLFHTKYIHHWLLTRHDLHYILQNFLIFSSLPKLSSSYISCIVHTLIDVSLNSSPGWIWLNFSLPHFSKLYNVKCFTDYFKNTFTGSHSYIRKLNSFPGHTRKLSWLMITYLSTFITIKINLKCIKSTNFETGLGLHFSLTIILLLIKKHYLCAFS